MQLNVSIGNDAYRQAKIAAAQEGILLREWVEKMILAVTKPQPESAPKGSRMPK